MPKTCNDQGTIMFIPTDPDSSNVFGSTWVVGMCVVSCSVLRVVAGWIRSDQVESGFGSLLAKQLETSTKKLQRGQKWSNIWSFLSIFVF